MNSSAYNTPYGPRHYGQQPRPQYSPKPHVPEDTLLKTELAIEKKTFTLALKENLRGRFLRINEIGANGKSATVIVPATGLKDFQKFLTDMVKADGEIPAKDKPPQQ